MKPNELSFEEAIEATLLAAGYVRSDPAAFDRSQGLDQDQLFAFVEATQPKEWANLVGRYGGQAEEARSGFTKRLCHDLDHRGTVDVLRHGIVDLGVSFRLAYFKPAHGLTPELVARYGANRVSLTRQLRYEAGSEKSLDLAILVNGIPTATAELKNPITGQTVEDATRQYRKNRDPGNVTLSRRSVVHFAVDPDRVAMTTRLAGEDTQFLPFNLGADGGAGNPVNPAGYRTAYLWERVWSSGLLARHPEPLHPRRATRGGHSSGAPSPRAGDLPPLPPVGLRPAPGEPCPRPRAGAVLPGPALGWLREVQHHRLDCPPSGQPS